LEDGIGGGRLRRPANHWRWYLHEDTETYTHFQRRTATLAAGGDFGAARRTVGGLLLSFTLPDGLLARRTPQVLSVLQRTTLSHNAFDTRYAPLLWRRFVRRSALMLLPRHAFISVRCWLCAWRITTVNKRVSDGTPSGAACAAQALLSAASRQFHAATELCWRVVMYLLACWRQTLLLAWQSEQAGTLRVLVALMSALLFCGLLLRLPLLHLACDAFVLCA